MALEVSLFGYAPHTKAALALRLLLAHLNIIDLGAARTLMTEGDHRLDRIGLALEHRLDRAIGAVRRPAGDAKGFRLAPRRVTKEDTLDPAADDYPPSDRAHGGRAKVEM
jgi:hypothetical protein